MFLGIEATATGVIQATVADVLSAFGVVAADVTINDVFDIGNGQIIIDYTVCVDMDNTVFTDVNALITAVNEALISAVADLSFTAALQAQAALAGAVELSAATAGEIAAAGGAETTVTLDISQVVERCCKAGMRLTMCLLCRSSMWDLKHILPFKTLRMLFSLQR